MEIKDREAKLLERRIIGLPYNIDKEIVDKIAGSILELNLKSFDEIKLLIDSGGGKIKPAFKLVDVIRLSKAPVSGIVVGLCGSAAVSVLQACHKRLSTPHSKFFLHFVRSDFTYKAYQTKQVIVRSLMSQLKETICNQRETEDIILARVNITRKGLRKLMHNGERDNTELTADEALALGLVDEIVEGYDLL